MINAMLWPFPSVSRSGGLSQSKIMNGLIARISLEKGFLRSVGGVFVAALVLCGCEGGIWCKTDQAVACARRIINQVQGGKQSLLKDVSPHLSEGVPHHPLGGYVGQHERVSGRQQFQVSAGP